MQLLVRILIDILINKFKKSNINIKKRIITKFILLSKAENTGKLKSKWIIFLRFRLETEPLPA